MQEGIVMGDVLWRRTSYAFLRSLVSFINIYCCTEEVTFFLPLFFYLVIYGIKKFYAASPMCDCG